MLQVQGILAALRHQTHDLHIQLEHHLDLLNLTDLRQYTLLLQKFHQAYAVLEPQVYAQDLWTSAPWQPHPKLPWLEQDLRFLDAAATARPIPFELTGPQERLGAVYVVEGSTLGGQLISRHLQKLGITPQTGGRFFSAYQEHTGHQWKQTRTFIEAHTADPESVVLGAQKTFQFFHHVLLDRREA